MKFFNFINSVSDVTLLPEIRGVWLADYSHSTVLTSKNQIIQALDFLQEKGFNSVFPAVWNRGFTAFPSQVMGNYNFPIQDPFYHNTNFDPLREIVIQASARNLAVIPWFEYGFAASPAMNGGHILQQNPQWSALDKKGNNVRQGGLTWMNSLDLDVQQFMLELILEVVKNYEVDGIQGDDRLPALPFTGGYDIKTKNQFKEILGREPPSQEKEKQWVQFRADILTQFLARLFKEVKKVNSNLIVSISSASFPFCLSNLMQDSNTWIEKNLVDFLHPQLYRESFNTFNRSKYKPEVERIKATFSPSQRTKFAPGIALTANGIRLSSNDIIKCVQFNRENGLSGQVFFFYEGLRKNNDEIAIALHTQGNYHQIASLPYNS